MATMSVAFAPRPEDEKYYGQVDKSHRIHDPTLYPEQPEAAGVRTATFLKKSGNVWYLMRVSLVMGDRVRAFTFWKTFASFVQLHQDLLGSMPLLPLPHLPPLYYFDSYRTRDQETIDLRLNAITDLMDHLARAHMSTEARGIVEKFLLEAEEGSNEFHPRLTELLKAEIEIQNRVQRQQQEAARVAASLEALHGQHRHLEALVHQRSQYLQQLNEREAIVTTREGAVAEREAALQGRSDRVAAREAACRVSEAQAVERKAYFQGLKPETERLEAEIASLRHTTAELQSVHDGWKKRVAEERAKVAVCIEQANLRTQEFQGELVARERELSTREARVLNKEVLLGTLAEEYRKARQRMPGLPPLPTNFRALTNG